MRKVQPGWIKLNAMYSHDIRDKPNYFSTTQNKGRLVMTWAAVFYFGVSPLMCMSVRMNSENYCDIRLEGLTLLPLV